MPSRRIVSKELAEIFKIIAHPDRVRIIAELRSGEKAVNTLVELLELPGPRVSQHLSLLRAHRMVGERREGRHHFYHLMQPEIADWIVEGLAFVQGRITGPSQDTIKSVRRQWSASGNNATS